MTEQQHAAEHSPAVHHRQRHLRSVRSQARRRSDPATERLARALGWLSIGLGMTEVAAPRSLARLIGLDGRTGDEKSVMRTLRLFGMREIAAGLGIFSNQRPIGWMWARVAGDIMDLSFLGAAMRSTSDGGAGRLAAAAATVAGVTALDIVCGQRLSARRSVVSELQPDGYMRLTNNVAVNRPPSECYAFWRRFENLPRIMYGLDGVTETGNGRSHWQVIAPTGLRLEWDAEITQDEPDKLIAWRSVEGAELDTDGRVHFLPGRDDHGTLIRVVLRYRPPGGALSAAVTKLFGRPAQQLLKQDLRRFKQMLETGDIITTADQPHGPAAMSLTRALSRS